jgi:glycosyltransferase involved in cell wall biosynthesis
MLGTFENIDRRITEPDLEPVDVLMLTLDAETYLEKCLDSIYREIPVNRVIALDGGSKDKTMEIFEKYPRVELHVRPDIRTTGKGAEFLFSRAATPWVAMIDADMELAPGWYDEMAKHKGSYDYFESRRIMHYEFYRDVPESVDMGKRSAAWGQLGRLDCLRNYHVDDDYMWRHTDMLLRQVIEKDGYKFGKVATTYHYHHTTDKPMYESDEKKKGSRLVFEEPTLEILDKANRERTLDISRKAVVKYLDPGYIYPRDDDGLLLDLTKLDMEWVKKTNVKWYNVLVEYRKKNYIKVKLAGMMGSTTNLAATVTLVRTITKAFRDYARHITAH